MKQISIHRKEQWDLGCNPIVCIHYTHGDAHTRIFCLWFWGIEIGSLRWFRT
jgi:hypothetical protein